MNIPEEDTLQNHRCENLKSYIELVCALPSNRTNANYETVCEVMLSMVSGYNCRSEELYVYIYLWEVQVYFISG
jgi:hypothetical protein